MKKPVSDKQFKNQVIFTIKGMQANVRKIRKMFPREFKLPPDVKPVDTYQHTVLCLQFIIDEIKFYQGKIIRKPK